MYTPEHHSGTRTWGTAIASVRKHTEQRVAGRHGDDGLTLIEVLVAFVVLMVALIPLSYLFTTSVVEAGQANNQLTALSIAERWVETLANTSPPVNPNSGAVIVDTAEPPSGPAPTFTTSVTAASNGHALNAVSSISVTSTASFAAASASAPQVADVTTGAGASAVIVPVSYTSTAGNVLTCASNPCSSSTGTMSGTVTQTEIATPTETRGSTVYALSSKYEWETVQNSGVVSTTYNGASSLTLPSATILVASVANFTPASVASPQTAKVVSSNGVQTVYYTGIQAAPAALIGVTGGTGTVAVGATVKQNPKPNLCTSGTPQLLKLTVTVSWGPNADQNSVQDSEMINYPPFGVQTLGFLALQITGDSTASDAQGNPWSERVTAIPVTFTGPQVLNLYPDAYGCVFAQVKPGTYTVSIGQPVSGTPSGSTYGSPVFVANASGGASAPAGSYTNHVWSPPTSLPQGTVPTITVVVGAVTRIQAIAPSNFPSYDQASTVNFTYPSTTSVEDGVVCPGAGTITCVATGENANGTAQVSWSNGTTWSTPVVPGAGTVTRITSSACAATTACVGVGYGSGGAVILRGSTGSPPSFTADSLTGLGVSTAGALLTQVACPTATQCVAIGTTSAGAGVVLTGTIGASSDTWVSDTVPATTSLYDLQCPASANGCVALATTSSAPVIVSGPAAAGAWVTGTASGFTVSALTQVVCPTASTCLAIGIGKIGLAASSPITLSGIAASGLGSAVAWTADTISGATVSSLSSITCPSTTKCLVVGTGTSGATTGALLLWGATAGPLTAEFPLNGASTVSALTQLVCPSTTTCAGIGNSAGTPIIFTFTISAASSDTWHSDTVPNGAGTVTSLGKATCPAAASCLITATGTVSGSPAGFLISTSTLGGTTTSWAAASSGSGLPSSDNMLYFDGVACTGGATGTCAAVGATPSGAVVLTSSSGPTGSWADVSPVGLSGNATAGVPIEINNSGLNSGLTANQTYVNAVTAGAATNVTSLPLVFPFSGGYNLFAGDCSSEANAYNVDQVLTVPGGTSGTTTGMPTTTVPLGLASLQVSSPISGLAHAGVSATLVTVAAGGCAADTYTLPSTGVDGLSRTAVPYGTYTLSVNGTGYGTLVVSGSSETLSGASSGNATYALPSPVLVTA